MNTKLAFISKRKENDKPQRGIRQEGLLSKVQCRSKRFQDQRARKMRVIFVEVACKVRVIIFYTRVQFTDLGPVVRKQIKLVQAWHVFNFLV